MALAITAEHRALAEVAGALVRERGALAAARAQLDGPHDVRDSALWKQILTVGWLGLHVPVKYGGQGYGLPEQAVVIEQLGRAVTPGPYLPTVVASAVIATAGTPGQRGRWLPGLSTGELTAGVATRPARAGTPEIVAPTVLAGQNPELFLLPVGADVLIVEAGAQLTLEPQAPADRTRAVLGLRCPAGAVADILPGAAPALVRLLRVLACAEAAGAMEACVETTVAYVATREQFGRPVGSYQAVKHHCANMLVDTQLAAAAAWDAARGAEDDEEAELASVAAAAFVFPAYQRVAELTIQLHGGIGYTWEHDAHLYLRRALTMAALLGAPDALCDRVVELHRAGVRRHRAVDLPPEADSYRRAARAFVAEQQALVAEQRRQHFARSGYLVPHWPSPYGRGAEAVEQLVIDEELADLERPNLGLGEWILPTLLQCGSAEQLERLLWPSLEGQLRWCQLFSEPDAGSDAAAVRTRADRVPGGWRVNGQKVWTSDARSCQRGLATVRTDPEASKHRGITAMIIDLSAPGVQIRPLVEITGQALFNEVFLDEVFVPDADVLGQPGDGWRVAMATLGHERVSIGGGSVTLGAGDLVGLLDAHQPGDAGFAREVGALLAESHCAAMLNVRHAARAVAAAQPGVEGNLAKLFGAEHAQRVSRLALRIAPEAASEAASVGAEPRLLHDYLFARCLTIAGGTSEVVRNQIAERVLGLPREPAYPATDQTRKDGGAR